MDPPRRLAVPTPGLRLRPVRIRSSRLLNGAAAALFAALLVLDLTWFHSLSDITAADRLKMLLLLVISVLCAVSCTLRVLGRADLFLTHDHLEVRYFRATVLIPWHGIARFEVRRLPGELWPLWPLKMAECVLKEDAAAIRIRGAKRGSVAEKRVLLGSLYELRVAELVETLEAYRAALERYAAGQPVEVVAAQPTEGNAGLAAERP